MTITLYDSLTREKTPFSPIEEGKVGMYVCGPTVYSDCHVGHTMGPVLFDAIARWFAARGYDVRFVNNITDIEDKIIKRSQESGEPWQDITQRYTKQYNELLEALNVTTVTDQPKCTDYIPEMIAFIEDLVSKDRAYIQDDGVYYRVKSQENYGKLSGRNLDDAQSDNNSESTLEHRADFALWKIAKPDEPSWDSPWGAGRPGWHIECSVMSSELLGGEFDIHGGGEELKFPHHENEIAQSEAHGDCYAKHWMHNGLVQYEGKKISKSDPRMRDFAFSQQFQALYLIKTYGGEALRFHILRGHYRRPQEFKPSQLEASATTLERLRTQLAKILGDSCEDLSLSEINALSLNEEATKIYQAFTNAMDDDFNTGAAIAQLFPLTTLARKAKDEEAKQLAQACYSMARILGLFAGGLVKADDTQEETNASGNDNAQALMDILVKLRNNARAQRNFDLADAIRDQLAEAGFELKDGANGTEWTRKR